MMLDKEWKLLEWITVNDRTLICYYNGDTLHSGIVIFHLTDQPNEISRESMYSTWGYLTHAVFKMNTLKEAAEVYGLYLNDLNDENYWWENDNDK